MEEEEGKQPLGRVGWGGYLVVFWCAHSDVSMYIPI